ncbi:unnamed protein product [Adineta ricciae]|uniref:DUF6606 domain-containing protein n=1 Tax=Adineta ricciae TaxID=249248 RepID=A0A815Z7E2_ADIRI|nr:unnamed protein product [Adineta ricciae]
MDESILNHLFLPHYLPNSADEDFLIKGKHENEYKLLDCLDEYFNSIAPTHLPFTLPVFRILHDGIKRWAAFQNPQNFSASNIQSTIEKLSSGSFLPLYFHTQNASILIEIDEKNQAVVSAWEVLLSTSEITSSVTRHYSCFPVATYRLRDRNQLSAKTHCEVLVDFMMNTIEYSKLPKVSGKEEEILDVPESHYVCQWWIQHFQGLIDNDTTEICLPFKKKHRDQVRSKSESSPFRRSGLWMTIKVVVQIILTKSLKENAIIIYKLFVTHFLTYIICTRPPPVDLLVHSIRKIVRRLNKIDHLIISSASESINQWIENTKNDIQDSINRIFPKSDWQQAVRMNEIRNEDLSMENFHLNNTRICKHLCRDLKAYLDGSAVREALETGVDTNGHYGDSSQNTKNIDYVPSLESLTNKCRHTMGVALTRLEIWVDTHLEQWISHGDLAGREKKFQDLLVFFEEYQNAALTHYGSTDPVGYSRFILTSLTIIRSMHHKLCQDNILKRLNAHSIQIPNLIELFEFLVLPNRDDMVRAESLYDFFKEFASKSYPDLLTDIKHVNAFGVYYAGQSLAMNNSIKQIRRQAEIDKQNKIQEVQQAKQRYTRLMDSIRGRPCSCYYDSDYNSYIECKVCSISATADRITVSIFENPMPVQRESALAVIFELQMPSEIRCYREVLWQFLNRPKHNSSNMMHRWLNVSPHQTKLSSYYHGPEKCKVNLVSSTTSVTQNYSSHPPRVGSTAIEGFLFENSLEVRISPTQPIEFKEEQHMLTPQLNHSDYKQLQFAINSTGFIQNDVIAKLSNCSLSIQPKEFVEFGSFRSGHRLQWWNLLAALETGSLSIAEESVAILITHSILQYGPVGDNKSNT